MDVAAVAVRHKKIVLQLSTPVFPCSPEPTVSYAQESGGTNVEGIDGTAAAAISHQVVTNKRKSGCTRSQGVSGNSGGQGKSVRLKFRRTLDTARALQASAFRLAGASAPSVAGAAYTADAAGVALTLNRALAPGETVEARYERPVDEPGLWNTAGEQIADFSGVTVTNEEPAAPSVSVSDARAAEGEAVEFTVSLSEASDEQVTVDYATSDGTAESGTDFTAGSGTLTFSANDTSETVRVETADDSADEEDETFTLTLSNPAGATLDDAQATGTIEDDDEALAALTAAFHGMPTEHNGGRLFSFEIRFSEEFEGLRLTALEAGALEVTGGRLVDVKRTTRGENRSVTARVRPTSSADVTVSLAATTDCSASTAICAQDGRMLSNSPSATVSGPGNTAATGAPAITGEARVGETLTASTDGIADADGLSGASFAFQWVSIDDGAEADIAGATGASYTLADSDEGKAVKVRVTFTDDAGSEETLTSAPTATVSARSNAAATGAPAITGEAQVGETLTASTDGIADADGLSGAAFTFQWMSSAGGTDTDITGATNASYTLADSDAGKAVKVRVTFTDDAGHEETLTSAPTATVAGRPNVPATGAPAIAGEARAGETLTASTDGIADADGLSGAAFGFQWVSSAGGTDTDIAGATGASYELRSADVGAAVKVRASFTDDRGFAEALTSTPTATVEPRRPLTAEFRQVPAEHDGNTFTFRVRFSEDPAVSFRVLRDEAFTVTGGTVRRATRVNDRNDLREIHVQPSGSGAVSITLPATANCDSGGAICTSDGRPLSNSNSASVIGPVGISVADARVEEGAGAVLAFAVTLSRAATNALTVDYATSDGSARAGEDYTAASGTLSFQAGESSGTIEVAVLDDAHDEGEETLTLTLSNASGAVVTDGEATGTIENTDLMPAALLARFGRATAEQVVTHIEERMAAPRRRGFRARLAGRELQPGSERDFALGLLSSFAPMGAGPAGAAAMGGAAMGGAGPMAVGPHAAGPGAGAFGAGPAGMTGAMGMTGLGGGATGMTGLGTATGAMGMAGQHAPMGAATAMGGYGPADGMHGGGLFGSMSPGGGLFSNSEFELNGESRGGMLSVWSSSSRSYFRGMEDALSLDGDVRTTMIGADYARGPLTVGLSVGRTMGLGGYSGPSGGRMTTSMTGFYPWAGYQVNDRVSVWGVTGYGTGAVSLTPDGAAALETGVSMAMSAVGTRGELVGSRATGGFALAFKADAMWVGAASDLLEGPAGRLNASEAGVTRVRTALEGSRGFSLGGGRLSLTPSVEVGLRRDGGDAETGAGMDVGGGLAFSDTVSGLSLDVRVRTLVVHQAEGFAERGMSLSFGWDPTPSSPLGLTAKLAPSWGGESRGGAESLWGNQMAYGMGSQQMYGSGDRVDAEVGYGLPVGARLVGTPRVGLATSQYGRDYRFGYGLRILESGSLSFEAGVDAQRRESPMQGGTSNGFLGRATLGW